MEKTLVELGLNEKEIAVYLAILELGQANVLEIARKSGIPRATVYGFLETLLQQHLISSVLKGKRRYYLAEDPIHIRDRLFIRQQRFERILPQLENLYLHSTNKPVVRAFEGPEGIKKMFEDIHASVADNSQYDAILNSHDEFAAIGQIYDDYVQKRINRHILIRVISEKSDLTKNWLKKQKETLRQVKYLPKGQHFSVSYHIYGNKVSMFSLQGPIVGVIIENKEIAEMEKLQFEYMWRALK